jgi:F420H(2)-dependent quinone reductase
MVPRTEVPVDRVLGQTEFAGERGHRERLDPTIAQAALGGVENLGDLLLAAGVGAGLGDRFAASLDRVTRASLASLVRLTRIGGAMDGPSERNMRRARAVRRLSRLRRLQPQIGRLHAAVIRRSGGRIRRSRLMAGGQPVLALTTTGRRSGRRRSTTVAYVRRNGAIASAGLNLGSDRDPAWALNLRADPSATIEIEGERRVVTAREAKGVEATDLWAAFDEQFPMIAASRKLASETRDAPIFVWEPREES